MKKLLAVLTATSALVVAQADTPIFKQVANIDVSSLYANDGTTPHYLGGVASDGNNIFISGWRTGSAGSTQRIVKIANPLGASTASTYISQNLAEANSRMTKLVYANNSLYWGIGGGASSGTTTFGLRRITDNAGVGQIDTAFGGDGLLTPAEARNNVAGTNRIDSFDIDPTTGELVTVGFFAQNSLSPYAPKVYRSNAITGAFIGSYDFNTDIPVSGNTLAFRDISFGTDGKLYSRRDTPPTARNLEVRTLTGSLYSLGTSLFDGAGANSIMKVDHNDGAGFSDNFLAFNDLATSGVGLNTLTIASETGSIVTRLTGSENGFTAWGTQYLSSTTATIAGKRYLIVTASSANGSTSSTNRDQVRIYEVVPEPGTMTALGLGVAALLRKRKAKKNA